MLSGAILQSNYIPWKGYFDIIRSVDLFIFHDDLQFTKNDWRNRNKIKTAAGVQWLTIPCGTDEKRLICEVELKDNSWQKKHWQYLIQNYRQTPFFDFYREFFEEIYLGRNWKNLSELNQYIIKSVSYEFLKVKTKFADSREYNLNEKKAYRVRELLLKSGIDLYLSGPSAKNYLTEEFLKESGIEICWMDYSVYPEYTQLFPPFVHDVTILDLIFNTGPAMTDFMKKADISN